MWSIILKILPNVLDKLIDLSLGEHVTCDLRTENKFSENVNEASTDGNSTADVRSVKVNNAKDTEQTLFIDLEANGFRTNNNRETIHIGLETGQDKI